MTGFKKRMANSWAVLCGRADICEQAAAAATATPTVIPTPMAVPTATTTAVTASPDGLTSLINTKDGLGSVAGSVFFRYDEIRKAREMGYSWAVIAESLNLSRGQASPLAVAFNKASKGETNND